MTTHYSTVVLLLGTALAGSAHQAAAQDVAATPLDNHLIESAAAVTKLADGFVFTEWPAVDQEGNVFFSDVRTSKTSQWTIDGELTTFWESSGEGNGMFFDQAGNLLVCQSVRAMHYSTSSTARCFSNYCQ